MTETTTSKRLTRARSILLMDQPFFGTLALKMPLVEDASAGTMMTNGRRIRYNPAFVESLTDKELQAVLAHEVMHVADGHIWRRENRDPAMWNEAGDYAINQLLVQSGFQLPKDCLLDSSLTGSAESIFKALKAKRQEEEDKDEDNDNSDEQPEDSEEDEGPQDSSDDEAEDEDEDSEDEGDSEDPSDEPEDNGEDEDEGDGSGGSDEEDEEGDEDSDGSGEGEGDEDSEDEGNGDGGSEGDGEGEGNEDSDPGRCGGVEDCPEDEDPAEQEADWKVAMVQAAMVAESQGHLPGHLKQMVDRIVNPKVPWTVVLRDFLERTARNDYNWTRPNVRHTGRGIILPSLISDELPEIVLVIDSSGSTVSYLEQFAAEASAVLGAFDTTVHLIYCDTRVSGHQVLTKADLPFKLEVQGFGGTDFRPPFRWVEEQGLTPACLIYLTDLYGPFPDSEPDYPVLWVNVGRREAAPFGETVKLES